MKLIRLRLATILALTLAISAPAFGDYELVITEVDPFGTDFNSDDDPDDVEWFEVTNLGDMPWTEATDGVLYYDDSEPKFDNADPMSGVPSIAPGESVIFLNHDGAFPDPSADGAIEFFLNEFPDYSGQVGTFNGSGLSSGGDDGANIWLGEPMSNDDIISSLVYPDNSPVAGQSYQLPGAAFADPTPGVFVPEPNGAVLALLGLIAFIARRKR